MDTGAEGGKMVFVKVRETYDLHTVKGKMTIIGVHTPKPAIIKDNFPGLLMQCKAYRPVSADVRIACASVLPLDPQGVGLAEGDVAPEDVFNPILYKACSNFGMSQIEARINLLRSGSPGDRDVRGSTADVDVDTVTNIEDEFPLYYGLLSNAHEWRHANPQSGLEMTKLRPLVYEILYNVGDNSPVDLSAGGTDGGPYGPGPAGARSRIELQSIRGNAKPIPWINCTSYGGTPRDFGFIVPEGSTYPDTAYNAEQDVPWINCLVGAIIVPPSRLHELFYRMVVEWTIEFSQIRSVSEITNWAGLGAIGEDTHYQNYSYEATKEALTGSKDSVMSEDTNMVSTTASIQKVF